MVLCETSEIVWSFSAYGLRTVVWRSHGVSHQDVDVGFRAAQKECGGMFCARSEVETVIEKNEIGRCLAYAGHHFVKVVPLCASQRSANAVHLEKSEIILLYKSRHHIYSLVSLFFRVAETVGTAPNAETGAETCRTFCHRSETVWKMFLETRLICGSVDVCTVNCTCVKGIYVKLHAVGVFQPTEKIEVNKGLLFACSLVGVVNPRKIFRSRRRFFGYYLCFVLGCGTS